MREICARNHLSLVVVTRKRILDLPIRKMEPSIYCALKVVVILFVVDWVYTYRTCI